MHSALIYAEHIAIRNRFVRQLAAPLSQAALRAIAAAHSGGDQQTLELPLSSTDTALRHCLNGRFQDFWETRRAA